MFARAGLTEIRVEAETVILPGPVWVDEQYGFGRLPEFAERAGVISPTERHAWQTEVEARSRGGGLFVAFTGFRTVGRRPNQPVM